MAHPNPSGSANEPPRIAIVGGGFGGLAAARALRGCAADVVLIDRRNHNVFRPPLYQVATALLAPSEVATPIADCAPETFGYQLPYAPRDL
jgi:NADH dehydrogenase